jgi:hypothetical protein
MVRGHLTEGEGRDSANIDLPAQQVELINAVTAVGTPTVAVVALGRPQGLASVIDQLPTVVTGYFGGTASGDRDRRGPLRRDQPRRQAAVLATASRRPGADVGGADGGPGRALPVPAELPAGLGVDDLRAAALAALGARQRT